MERQSALDKIRAQYGKPGEPDNIRAIFDLPYEKFREVIGFPATTKKNQVNETVEINRHKSIKAIDTLYNGNYFRSRLEARWAVYFDALSIRYQYEKEGFQLETGERYLPDFYLPDHEVYAEIKPNIYDNEDKNKHLQFVFESGYTLMICKGNPAPKGCEVLRLDFHSVVEHECGVLMPKISKYFPIHWNGWTEEREDEWKEYWSGMWGFDEAVLAATKKRFEYNK